MNTKINSKDIIPIFFTIDDGYAPYLATALVSTIKNSSPARRYRAVVLYQDLCEENRRRLGALATDNFAVDFIPMCRGLDAITDRMSNRLRCDYFTLTIYFRLFIPAMFPEYDRGIYIDSDIVLNSDIAELYDTDIGDALIGACADCSVSDVPELAGYMERAVGVDRHSYVNSGVLLMNLRLLREAELDRHFLSLLNSYHFDCIAPDQDYLNAMCYGRIHYLDERYELDLDISNEELRQWVGDNLWEMTKVINVWVSPFINDHIVSEDTSTAGFTFLPYFAPEEMLQGCNTAVPGCFSGIFLNLEEVVGNGYCNAGIAAFAHEAGHYLGLDHVFEEDWCDDTPQYDRARYRTEQYIPGIDTYLRYPIDASAEPYTALNVMDYDIVIYSGITPQQAERVRYTLQHACLVPGGKPLPGNMKSCAGPAPKVMY
mgnify:CR=1 FL=1